MKRQTIQLLLISILPAVLAGCGGSNTEAFLNDIEELKAENTELTHQVDALQKENNQLREQSVTLSSLKREVRLELIDTLAEIKVGNRTGIFDKDENGTPETLVIYVEPLDNQQDYIKAIGECRIELWDLNQPEGQAKIITRGFNPADLNPNWGGNIFSSYYRLAIDAEDIEDHILLKKPKELTVKVTFTDYIGGKTLSVQKVIALD